jgi:hypothetical protein
VCRETGTHGFVAEAGEAILSPTVTQLPTAFAPTSLAQPLDCLPPVGSTVGLVVMYGREQALLLVGLVLLAGVAASGTRLSKM